MIVFDDPPPTRQNDPKYVKECFRMSMKDSFFLLGNIPREIVRIREVLLTLEKDFGFSTLEYNTVTYEGTFEECIHSIADQLDVLLREIQRRG